MGIATLTTFESAGGKFSNFRGIVVEAAYTAYAYFGKNRDRIDGFFLRLLIVAAPGEDLDEPLERFYSGGQLKFTVPSTGPDETDIVNLESTNDAKLQGPYAWSLMQKAAFVKGTNIDALVDHINAETDFDQSRWTEPRIDDALVGLDAYWIDVEQPARDFADKSKFRKPTGDKADDDRKPTFLAPDKVFGYVEKSKLPKADATSAMQPSAVSDELQATMTTFIVGLAADGPVEISSITNALIKRQKEFGDDLPNLLTLATVEWLSASDEWTFAEGKVTLA